MKLSTKGRYGLRAMVDIAVHSSDEPVSIISIARRQNISENYLEQIISKMKKAGLLISHRGAGGGYKIAKPLNEISVGDIIRALEGNLNLVDCPGLKDESKGCKTSELCVTKYVWEKVNDSVKDTFDNISLEELASESKEKIELHNDEFEQEE